MKYKETSLGKIPESWDVVNLEEQLESLIDYRGKTPKKSESGIVTLSAKSVKMGEIDYSKAYYVSPETYEKFMVRGFPQKGDVLLTTEAPLGCVAKLDRSDVCIAQRLITLRGKKNILHNDYLRFYLSSPIGQQQLHSRATGSTVQGIKRSEFSKVELILPDYDSQKVIVQHISALEDKITLNTQINQTLEAMAQALFQSWFVDFDPVKAKMEVRANGGSNDAVRRAVMAVISGKSEEELVQFEQENPAVFGQLAATADLFPEALVESELGLIPEGWEVKKIGDIAEIIKGKSYKSSELQESNIALVTLKSFNRGGGYRLDGLKEYTGTYKDNQLVNAGDLIVAYTDVTQAADVIGKPAMVIEDERYEKLVISLDVAKIQTYIDSHKYFLYCLAMTNAFQSHTKAHSTGTTVLHLSKNAIPDFYFSIPDAVLMEIFTNSVASIYVQINRSVQENVALSQTRDTLLPKLLSGEIDLSSFGDREVGE